MSAVRKLITDEPVEWLNILIGVYKITANFDAEHPELVSLKYDQLESPMHEPLVQECRGMVVDVARNKILAHPYDKFWNHGDLLADPIDWSAARVLDKLDGSLMILSWNDGQEMWDVASSGTPRASGSFGSADITFREAFWSHFESLGMRLPGHSLRDVTFMLELCDQPNRVVVKHDKPRLVLHGARDLSTGSLGWEMVKSHPIGSIEECLAAAEALDPINSEGFVVVCEHADRPFARVKIKSPRYVILHHMKGVSTPRRAIELWQTGESAELLSHFPEMAPDILPVHARLDECAQRALADVVANSCAPTRKDFAAAVKDKPWASVCFKMLGDNDRTVEKAAAFMRAQSLQSLENMLERAS